MNNERKEDNLFTLVKLIILLILLFIIAFVYVIIRDNSQAIVTGYQKTVNVVVGAIDVEKSNIIPENLEAENEEIVEIIPIDTSITENTKYEFENAKLKYYYNQLDSNAKTIYLTIENNLEKMKSGTYKLQLPEKVAKVLEEENGDELLNQEFQSAWDALSMDRVDIFFIDISKINLVIKKITYGSSTTYSLDIEPKDSSGYLEYDEDVIDAILSELKSIKNELVSTLTGNDYNKVLQVHDWIINNFEYSKNTSSKNAYNIYGAMVGKNCVCEGYAETLKYILDEINIPCILVSGTATNSEGKTESHEWNYVMINNKWYAVDCTWDDPIINGLGVITNSIKYKYFLKGATTINKEHIANGKISENGITFEYPNLEREDY